MTSLVERSRPPRMSSPTPPARRRSFSSTRLLDLGQHRRQDEGRRLRDLLATFVVPQLDEGRRMPTEEQIARMFSASRNAARTALQLLAREGLIARTVGRGTYAHPDPTLWRSTELVDHLLAMPSGERRSMRVIGFRIRDGVPEPMAGVLQPSASRLAVWEKVLFYDGQPGSLRTYYLPLRTEDELQPDDAAEDVYDVLGTRFGYRDLVADRIVRAIAADASAAELLRIDEGSPLLMITTIVRDASGSVVLVYDGRQRPDMVAVSMRAQHVTEE
jgi:GntR family transcriptional regulator